MYIYALHRYLGMCGRAGIYTVACGGTLTTSVRSSMVSSGQPPLRSWAEVQESDGKVLFSLSVCLLFYLVCLCCVFRSKSAEGIGRWRRKPWSVGASPYCQPMMSIETHACVIGVCSVNVSLRLSLSVLVCLRVLVRWCMSALAR